MIQRQNTTSWQLGVDTSGALTLTSVTYNANYSTSLSMIGEGGTLLFTFYVDINGALAERCVSSAWSRFRAY